MSAIDDITPLQVAQWIKRQPVTRTVRGHMIMFLREQKIVPERPPFLALVTRMTQHFRPGGQHEGMKNVAPPKGRSGPKQNWGPKFPPIDDGLEPEFAPNSCFDLSRQVVEDGVFENAESKLALTQVISYFDGASRQAAATVNEFVRTAANELTEKSLTIRHHEKIISEKSAEMTVMAERELDWRRQIRTLNMILERVMHLDTGNRADIT